MSGYHPNRAEYSGHNRKYPTGYRISTGWISQKSLIASKHYIKIVLWVTYLTFRMIIIFIYVQITPTYIHVYRYEYITHTHRYKHTLQLYIYNLPAPIYKHTYIPAYIQKKRMGVAANLLSNFLENILLLAIYIEDMVEEEIVSLLLMVHHAEGDMAGHMPLHSTFIRINLISRGVSRYRSHSQVYLNVGSTSFRRHILFLLSLTHTPSRSRSLLSLVLLCPCEIRVSGLCVCLCRCLCLCLCLCMQAVAAWHASLHPP